MIEVAPLRTEIKANWHNAVLYCQFLEVDEKKDWRLPTLDELIKLDEVGGDLVRDNKLIGKWYWTGTEDSELNAWMWEYDLFHPDEQVLTDKDRVNHVRAVRDI
jgi:hypothetical protein